MVVKAFGLTDVGMARTNNEDNFLFTQSGSGLINTLPVEFDSEAPWIFIVADGMGGGQAGEVASQMAVELVSEKFAARVNQKRISSHQGFIKALTSVVDEANRSILQAGQQKQELRGMGTTLTAATVHNNTVFFAQLGDSRAYLIRNNIITQMTKDQSLVAQMIAMGKLTPEEAKVHPRRNVILQALGVQARVDVAITSTNLRRGDTLLLCSDGLWGKVESDEIKEIVQRNSPQTACEDLVRLANERGGEDNITVLVANFSGDGLPELSMDADANQLPKKSRHRWWFWPWSSNFSRRD
jgi:protein phosphatase